VLTQTSVVTPQTINCTTPRCLRIASRSEPAGLQEIALHVDDHQRAVSRLEFINIRFCVDTDCPFAVHEGSCVEGDQVSVRIVEHRACHKQQTFRERLKHKSLVANVIFKNAVESRHRMEAHSTPLEYPPTRTNPFLRSQPRCADSSSCCRNTANMVGRTVVRASVNCQLGVRSQKPRSQESGVEFVAPNCFSSLCRQASCSSRERIIDRLSYGGDLPNNDELV